MIMNISKKINHWLIKYYRQAIVKEQYPMLTPISRMELKEKGALGVVYMLHHVIAKDHTRIPTNEDLKVSPIFLENLILEYKKKGFIFISLDNLYDITRSIIKPVRPFIVFTFDDGYLDNYTNALPIFEKYKIPFAIFVATNFIDKKAILWWDILEDLIMTHEQIETSDGHIYSCQTFQERWNTFRYLRDKILKLNQKNLLIELNSLFNRYKIEWLTPINRKGMSWKHIIELSKNPLCTIGGHTVSHPALNMLSDSDFKKEVLEGIEKIESITNKKISHFAYPYGSTNEIGERELRLIKEFCFKTVFCAYGGCITSINMHNTHCLPRVFLHEM